MPTTIIDGITTRYEVIGSGPPLLMCSPGGFDAIVEKWTTLGIYPKIRVLEHFSQQYSCIVFDRRECGQSGGRIEPVGWPHYVAQCKGLLHHLNVKRAHMFGGCMGCCPVAAFAVVHPEMVQSMILFWPVGGARWRINNHRRFADHLAYVEQEGLKQVVALVRAEGKTFAADPRVGPWATVIKNDPSFAESYIQQDVEQYSGIVRTMRHNLFDRDTAPGAEPEEMFELQIPAFIVPGRDASHATSAARYLEECLPKAEYWDAPVSDQTESNTMPRLLNFLERVNQSDQASPPQTARPS